MATTRIGKYVSGSAAADSGDRVLLRTNASFGPNPQGEAQTYVFTRGPAGWQMTPLTPPGSGMVLMGAKHEINVDVVVYRYVRSN